MLDLLVTYNQEYFFFYLLNTNSIILQSSEEETEYLPSGFNNYEVHPLPHFTSHTLICFVWGFFFLYLYSGNPIP